MRELNMGPSCGLRAGIIALAAPWLLCGLTTTRAVADPAPADGGSTAVATLAAKPDLRAPGHTTAGDHGATNATPAASGSAPSLQPMTTRARIAGAPQQPQWSLAEMAIPSRVSLSMAYARADSATQMSVHRAPIASYPPAASSGAARVQPAVLVGTATASSSRPLPGNSSQSSTSPSSKASDARRSDKLLLAQLDDELRRTQRQLNRADQEISEGQQQLGRWSNIMRQAMLEAGPDAGGLHPFVRVAQRYAGTPYVWGGESRNGFDCSGFIMVVMRDLGYRALPHSAAEQFTYGKPIAQALLKPGDLVFFKNTYKRGISHVGIYLGRRRFIHAAGTGKGTIVSTLDDAHYQAHYAGARRLIPARS